MNVEIEYDEDGYETDRSYRRRMGLPEPDFAEPSLCARCSEPLNVRSVDHAYCSRLCWQRDQRDRGRSEAGQCEGCGASLVGKRRDARWCSPACRMRAKRAA